MGQINVRLAAAELVRTVMPDLAAFVRYTLNFVPGDGGEGLELSLEAGGGEEPGSSRTAAVELRPGNWIIIAEGWVSAAEGAPSGLVKTAAGSADVKVLAGETATVDLVLDRIAGEPGSTGTLVWELRFPAALAAEARLSLSLLDDSGDFTPYEDFNLPVSGGQNRGSKVLPVGYYRVDITLTGGYFSKGRSTVVYIHSRLETRLAPVIFEPEDIPEPEQGGLELAIGLRDEEELPVEGLSPQGGPINLSASGAGGLEKELALRIRGFDSSRCLVDGSALNPGGEGVFLIRAADYRTGPHRITLIGLSAGRAKSRELSFTVVDSPAGGRPFITAASPAALAEILAALPENGRETPYRVRVSGVKLNSKTTGSGSLLDLYNAITRYVELDLSDCTGANLTDPGSNGKTYIVGIRLPAAVLGMASGAFSNYKVLVTVELPGVTEIKKETFKACNTVRSITLGAAPPALLGEKALPPNLEEIRVPAGAAAAYQNNEDPAWTAALKALVREY